MANALFDSAREAFLGGDLDWDADDIRLILVDEDDDTPSVSADDFLDDIAAGARVRVTTTGDTGVDGSGNLTSKTKADGVADAADVTLLAVTGDEAESIVLYEHTGTEGTSHLIAYIDTATGLPVTPSGGDIQITWDGGANKIFKL
jgi:hypothetical protein